MDIHDMKAIVGYSNSQAFRSKWFPQLSEEEQILVLAYTSHIGKYKSVKATASAKSLVSRFLVTGQLSEGKSGDSQKSAVRAYVRFCESIEFAVAISEGDYDIDGEEQ